MSCRLLSRRVLPHLLAGCVLAAAPLTMAAPVHAGESDDVAGHTDGPLSGPRATEDQKPAPEPRPTVPSSTDAGRQDPPARDRDSLPDPRDAHGTTVRPTDGPSPLVRVLRALLFVPRIGFEVVTAPVRGGIWAYERYRIGDRARQIFFDEDLIYGVYPIASIESGFGVNVGARAVHRNLLGDGERASLVASYGGRYRQFYELDASSGRRLGDRVELELSGRITLEPKERFYGFGNADELEADAVPMPIDPTTRERAIATRYRQQALAAGVELEARPLGDLLVEGRAVVEHVTFAGSNELGGDLALEDTFAPGSLGAYDAGVDSIYTELRLGYDSRRSASRFVSDALPGAGLLAVMHLGRQDPVTGSDQAAFYRYGADLQLLLDLYAGSRILALRFLVESVSGAVDEVPFIHLPVLGGDALLRGYPGDRFRDRALTLASAEYVWDLNSRLAASVFVDAGRVQRTLTDPALDGLRVGFGAGLQAHTMSSLLMRLHVASSIDGGVRFTAAFSPTIDVRVRRELEE